MRKKSSYICLSVLFFLMALLVEILSGVVQKIIPEKPMILEIVISIFALVVPTISLFISYSFFAIVIKNLYCSIALFICVATCGEFIFWNSGNYISVEVVHTSTWEGVGWSEFLEYFHYSILMLISLPLYIFWKEKIRNLASKISRDNLAVIR